MMKIKGELIRITTEDGLELQGLLFEPKEKFSKAIIHIHGWTGNFYENKFIDNIAETAISKGYAFLSFNNRGAGIIQEFIKRSGKKLKYEKIGGNSEKFEECLLDIEPAVDFMENLGYKDIVLEGHSLGCQKITFYQYKKKDKRVKRLILMAPVDDVNFSKKDLGNRYEEALNIAKKLYKENPQALVPDWMAFGPMLAAEVFLNVVELDSLSGKIFYYQGDLTEIKSINLPVLAIFGSLDQYSLDPANELTILKNKLGNCDTILIQSANHGFAGFEEELASQIGRWLQKLNL